MGSKPKYTKLNLEYAWVPIADDAIRPDHAAMDALVDEAIAKLQANLTKQMGVPASEWWRRCERMVFRLQDAALGIRVTVATAKSMVIAEWCFELSLDRLATYHRLPRR